MVGLQAEIYSIGNTSKDLKGIDQLISCVSGNMRLKLTLQLCRLHIMMRTCPSTVSSKYALALLQCTEYKSYLEYGFVLTNYAEFVSESKKCIDYYNQAIEIFKLHNKPHLEAAVNVSLCMEYAYIGKLQLAREVLKKAQRTDCNYIREEIFLNNKAVLDILSNEYSASTIKDLAAALLLTANKYEQLIIRANLLVCCVLENNMALAEQQRIIIEESGYLEYQYDEFLHIIYQNLLFCYKKQENHDQIALYEGKIKKLIDNPQTSTYTKNLASLIMTGKKDTSIFYSNFPFRVDFLGYWGCEISRDLEQF